MTHEPGNLKKGCKTPLLFQWRNLVCSEHGPKSTTRLVLIVLSLHMNSDGGSCFPSVETVAKRAGISKRAVCEHLNLAATLGWITRFRKGESGRSWRKWHYQATIPNPLRGDGESPTPNDMVNLAANRGYRNDINVVTYGHSNSSRELFKNTELLKLSELLGLHQRNKESQSDFISRVERANNIRIDRIENGRD